MAQRIEDYAVVGDTHTAALIGRDGSVDWLCLPRFDAEACFARLLGNESHGFWRIGPAAKRGEAVPVATRRRYRGDTLVLETEFDTPSGTVQIVDAMAIREHHPELIRLVRCLRGTVKMRMDLVVRFGYGSVMPWVQRLDGTLVATAGPDALALWTPIPTRGEDFRTVADFQVTEGQDVPFVLSWFKSHHDVPRPSDAQYVIGETASWWERWSSLCTYKGEWREAVLRSLITLKALTYAPTGGIVAAATTSLPEALGGSRNWDYRYCWLRDATLTLDSLMRGGYHEEALAWRDWLLRAAAGDPSKLQIMYGPAGERRLEEWEVPWLPGYEGSAPVRIGNAASGQYQLDVYGEMMSALYEAERTGTGSGEAAAWNLELAVMDFLETGWKEPDDGIWEVRGPRRQFTHSKVMAWAAFDRAIRSVEELKMEGPADRWRKIRDDIHAQVCSLGWNAQRNSFTQYYGSDVLDASLLMIPLVGFLPPHDKRVVSTVEAIERDLTHDGFVLRYLTDEKASEGVDGLTGREGAFLACSFWLADCLAGIGRAADARALFQRLLALRNDLGLLAEEYDPIAKRQVGNFPQAFSHVSLVNSACNLDKHCVDPAKIDPEAARHMMRRRAGRSRRWHAMPLRSSGRAGNGAASPGRAGKSTGPAGRVDPPDAATTATRGGKP